MKRLSDLQGLRGLAIIFVLLFHLEPQIFRNGFIGVDMFFVISGYLMGRILDCKLINKDVVHEFYKKRFIRIVPLYFLTILFTYIACAFLLLSDDRKQLIADLKWSVLFSSNLQPIFEKLGYWDQLVSFRFLTHAWSLGVEIQFYLIAPFIFYFLHKIREVRTKYAILFIVVSFLFQLYAPSGYSYGFLMSRDRWLVYFGDLSYVIYLVHWPLITGFKYSLPGGKILGINNLFVCIFVIFLSVFLHHFLEFGVAISLLSLLFVSLTLPYYITFLDEKKLTQKEGNKIDEAIRWNTVESKKIYIEKDCEDDKITQKWTNFTKEPELRCQTKGQGHLDILILGNSIAYRAFPLIQQILRNRFKRLRLYSTSGCVPLMLQCPEFTKAAKIVVEKMRPDLILHIHVSTEIPLLKPFSNPKTDVTFRDMQQSLDFYSKYTRFIVLDTPYYVAKGIRVAYEIAKRIQQGNSLDDLKTDFEQQKHHRARMEALKCRNCMLNRVHENFFDGDYYYFYNRSSLKAYTNDGGHLTSEGWNLVRNNYQKIIESLLRKFEKV